MDNTAFISAMYGTQYHATSQFSGKMADFSKETIMMPGDVLIYPGEHGVIYLGGGQDRNIAECYESKNKPRNSGLRISSVAHTEIM
jgi:hypothetical protein